MSFRSFFTVLKKGSDLIICQSMKEKTRVKRLCAPQNFATHLEVRLTHHERNSALCLFSFQLRRFSVQLLRWHQGRRHLNLRVERNWYLFHFHIQIPQGVWHCSFSQNLTKIYKIIRRFQKILVIFPQIKAIPEILPYLTIELTVESRIRANKKLL